MKPRFTLVACFVVMASPAFGQEPVATDLRARVAGLIEKIYVEPGTLVRKGDLLVEIDSALLRADLNKAEAQRVVAQARLNLSRAEVERAKQLLAAKAVSREEYERRLGELAVAEASVRVADAELNRAKLIVDYTKVRAPVEGQVGRVVVSVGGAVDALGLLLVIQSGNPAPPVKPSAKVKELMKERLAVLTKVAEELEAQENRGVITSLEVIPARRAVLDAALELAETPRERLELLRKDVQLTELVLRRVEERVKAGTAPPIAALRTQAVHLEARIRLAREEEKSK